MPRTTPTETLRATLILDGRSATAIARQAGLPQPVVTRFLKGQRTLSSRSLDRLAAELGLELRHAGQRAA